MATATRYIVARCITNWMAPDCLRHAVRVSGGRRHRSVEAAGRALDALYAATQRHSGTDSPIHLDVEIIAEADGELRWLTEDEYADLRRAG